MAARTLFVEMCVKLAASGETTNGAIAHHLMSADLKAVHAKLANTIASPLTAVEAARMADRSARSSTPMPRPSASCPTPWRAAGAVLDPALGAGRAGSGLDPVHHLDPYRSHAQPRAAHALDGSGGQCADGDAAHPRSADVVSLRRGPRAPPDAGDRAWLADRPRLWRGLRAGDAQLRQAGETYGEEGAINLASLARTKLILATADKNTAEVCSNFIGFREVRETDEAYSIGASRSRDAATITPRTEVKPLVIPDDIMNLPSLHGYVKFPEGFPAARIRFSGVTIPRSPNPSCARPTCNWLPTSPTVAGMARRGRRR
jgi:hypothetical protein